jgi:hypothetical protein
MTARPAWVALGLTLLAPPRPAAAQDAFVPSLAAGVEAGAAVFPEKVDWKSAVGIGVGGSLGCTFAGSAGSLTTDLGVHYARWEASLEGAGSSTIGALSILPGIRWMWAGVLASPWLGVRAGVVFTSYDNATWGETRFAVRPGLGVRLSLFRMVDLGPYVEIEVAPGALHGASDTRYTLAWPEFGLEASLRR